MVKSKINPSFSNENSTFPLNILRKSRKEKWFYIERYATQKNYWLSCPTLDVLNSFTAIRRESSDSIKRDRAPVLNLQYPQSTI